MPPITSLLVLIKTNGLCLHSIGKEGKKERKEEGRMGGRKKREAGKEEENREKKYVRKSQEVIQFLSALLRKVSLDGDPEAVSCRDLKRKQLCLDT